MSEVTKADRDKRIRQLAAMGVGQPFLNHLTLGGNQPMTVTQLYRLTIAAQRFMRELDRITTEDVSFHDVAHVGDAANSLQAFLMADVKVGNIGRRNHPLDKAVRSSAD